MNPLILINTRIFAGAADLTGFSNHVEIDPEAEDLDSTTFASGGWNEHEGGLLDTSVMVSGFWDSGDASKPDNRLWTDLGTKQPFTCGPKGANVGDLAWLLEVLEQKYTFGGDVGQLAPFSGDAVGDSPLARGVFLHDPGTARTANGSGTGVIHVAVPDGAKLWASLHVLSVAGTGNPTLTVKVQSDDNVGFTTPTDRITFDATSALTGRGQVKSTGGPIADDRYRVTYGVTGTAPSFLFVVAIGIA